MNRIGVDIGRPHFEAAECERLLVARGGGLLSSMLAGSKTSMIVAGNLKGQLPLHHSLVHRKTRKVGVIG